MHHSVGSMLEVNFVPGYFFFQIWIQLSNFKTDLRFQINSNGFSRQKFWASAYKRFHVYFCNSFLTFILWNFLVCGRYNIFFKKINFSLNFFFATVNMKKPLSNRSQFFFSTANWPKYFIEISHRTTFECKLQSFAVVT